MGQKTNPIGLRLAVSKDWRSKWYADKKEFGKLLVEDQQIRELLKKKLESASVPRIQICSGVSLPMQVSTRPQSWLSFSAA